MTCWPVAISMTRGDVIAMHVPSSWIVRSLPRAVIVEPPNESPSTAVTYGMRRRRTPSDDGEPPTLAKPSDPRLSGMRAPPRSAKYTNGLPLSTACSYTRCERFWLMTELLARLTVMSSAATDTGAPPSVA